MVQAISFDVGETLLRPYPSFAALMRRCCEEEAVDLPIGAEATVGALADFYFTELKRRGRTYSRSDEESERVWTTFYHQFLERHGIERAVQGPAARRMYRTFTDPGSYHLFDDSLEVVAELRSRGFRLGIISNWESWLTTLLRAHQLDQLFDFTVISAFVGFEKPDPRIFEAACHASRLAASEIVHVGDSLASDVEGARRFGLQAILLDREGRHGAVSVPRVTSLRELLDLPDLARPSA